MTDQKIKSSADKPPLGMIPDSALTGAARVFGYGAVKYAPGNFLQASLEDGAGARYISAARRHLAAMQQPNGLWSAESLGRLDDESGLPHIDHAICSLIMLRAIMIKDGALPEDPKAQAQTTNAEVAEQRHCRDADGVNAEVDAARRGPRFVVKSRSECNEDTVGEIFELATFAADYAARFNEGSAQLENDLHTVGSRKAFSSWKWVVVDTQPERP